MKLYKNSQGILIYEDDFGVKTLLPKGEYEAIVGSDFSTITIKRINGQFLFNTTLINTIQKENGSTYSGYSELLNVIKDYFNITFGSGSGNIDISELSKEATLQETRDLLMEIRNLYTITKGIEVQNLGVGTYQFENIYSITIITSNIFAGRINGISISNNSVYTFSTHNYTPLEPFVVTISTGTAQVILTKIV